MDRPGGVDRIAERTEVVVARIGRVDIAAPAHDLLRQRPVLREPRTVEQPLARSRMPLVHALEPQRVEPPLLGQQRGAVALLPQRLARAPRIDLGGGSGLERLEVQMQPRIGGQRVELRPLGRLDDPLALPERADQILLVPAREDDQFARQVVHARPHDRRIPLPAVFAHERRIGLHRILVEVVENEAVDAVARERTLAPDRQQPAPRSDDLDLFGRAEVAGGLPAALDRRAGEARRIFGRLDDALHAPVEFRGQRRGIRGDGDAQIGVESQQIGRQEHRGADALSVLGRHGDDQAADASRGESLQHPVVGAVEGAQFEVGTDPLREVDECGHSEGNERGRQRRNGPARNAPGAEHRERRSEKRTGGRQPDGRFAQRAPGGGRPDDGRAPPRRAPRKGSDFREPPLRRDEVKIRSRTSRRKEEKG